MAGHVISKYLLSLNLYNVVDVECFTAQNKLKVSLDLMDQNAVKELIEDQNPDIVINCARVLIDESEDSPAKAIYVNSYLPHLLEQFCQNKQTRIIHLSTDCVFSGLKGDYDENEDTDGKNYYAKTKALGEINNNKDLTIRTSFIGPNIGDKYEELFHWFMMQEGDIKGYSKVYWTGVTTLELAKCIKEVIEIDISGLYHLVPENKISKYELLVLIGKVMKRNKVFIGKDDKIVLDKSLTDNRKAIFVKNYPEMFDELKTWMIDNKELYTKYFSY